MNRLVVPILHHALKKGHISKIIHCNCGFTSFNNKLPEVMRVVVNSCSKQTWWTGCSLTIEMICLR